MLAQIPETLVTAVNLRRIALIQVDARKNGPSLKHICEWQRVAKFIHFVHVVSEKPRMVAPPPQAGNLISFSDDDLKLPDYPYIDMLVPTLQIGNCEVGHVFINSGATMKRE